MLYGSQIGKWIDKTTQPGELGEEDKGGGFRNDKVQTVSQKHGLLLG